MADIQFNLRIPENLKEKIKEAAFKNGRSINAEAQYRLEQSFQTDSVSKPFLSYDKDSMTLVIKDADERNRLAQIAAKAVFDALEQSLDQDDDEKKAP